MMRISNLWVWGRWPKILREKTRWEKPGRSYVSLWTLIYTAEARNHLDFRHDGEKTNGRWHLPHSLWVAGCIFEVIFQVFSLHNNLESLSKSCRLSKAWEIASLLFNLPSDWGIFPTGAKRGFSWLYPFSDKQQLGSFDPIIATNLQVALSRPEISYDFLLTVRREFRKGNMMSLWPPRLVWEPQLNAELISFFEQ